MKLFLSVNENNLNSDILPKIMKGSQKLYIPLYVSTLHIIYSHTFPVNTVNLQIFPQHAWPGYANLDDIARKQAGPQGISLNH